MTTKTDKKDPGEWGGLVCVHAFARPVLAGTGDRGCVSARPATAGTVINGLTYIEGAASSLVWTEHHRHRTVIPHMGLHLHAR